MDTVIKVEHIKKVYGEKVVLKDVSFSVSKGDIFGLIGPSGGGKTTIINILTGQIRSNEGRATIRNENCSSLSDDTYNNIGMVLDTPALFERLTCKQNLNVYATIFNIEKKRVSEVLECVGLQDDYNKRACNLSKGMRQRLVFARALLHCPKLLFLDEPTSSLDPQSTRMIWQIIKELQNRGVTVFLTSHRINEITELCNLIAFLHHGVIVEYGSPDDICRKYENSGEISILLNDGNKIILPKGEEANREIAKHALSGKLQSANTSVPNLEDVFIKITEKENKS